MKKLFLLGLVVGLLAGSWSLAQAAATPAGKVAPRPLYRDPPFNAPTDPVLCFNAESNKWFM